MNVIPIDDLDDERIGVYRNLKKSKLPRSSGRFIAVCDFDLFYRNAKTELRDHLPRKLNCRLVVRAALEVQNLYFHSRVLPYA